MGGGDLAAEMLRLCSFFAGCVTDGAGGAGHNFNYSETVAVYLRFHSSSQCKLSGMFVNLVTPVTVTFDDLLHFDFTVKPRQKNVYYFLRIEVVAFDLEHPEVRPQPNLYFHVQTTSWLISKS